MADDALEAVLRPVADGRLSAEEAGPILDALEARGPSRDAAAAPDADRRVHPRSAERSGCASQRLAYGWRDSRPSSSPARASTMR
jgi:hypothetical protein